MKGAYMEAKKYGDYLILWGVMDYDGDDEKTVAYFKDPHKAAVYALENRCCGVQMTLCKPEWKVKTED